MKRLWNIKRAVSYKTSQLTDKKNSVKTYSEHNKNLSDLYFPRH